MSSDKPDPRRLERWGIKATKIYLIVLVGGVPLGLSLGLFEVKPMVLNELGDFLAGAFGPLAIFWLVLGFFQQGQELRNSVATLELQARELANSVEQQAELVKVTRDQLEHERSMVAAEHELRKRQAKPQIECDAYAAHSGIGYLNHIVKLNNSGAPASRIRITASDGANSLLTAEILRLDRGAVSEDYRIRGIPHEIEVGYTLTLDVECHDDEGGLHSFSFSLTPPEKQGTYAVRQLK